MLCIILVRSKHTFSKVISCVLTEKMGSWFIILKRDFSWENLGPFTVHKNSHVTMKERMTPPPNKRKKRGRPRKPLGIVGAAVGFGKGPRIGVVLPCLLWSTCICMAGQRPQLTVERLRKKGPASDRIVGFCSLPKFAPPSELLLQTEEWVEVDRERGMGGRWRV